MTRSTIFRPTMRVKNSPKYLISNKGCHFWNEGFQEWFKQRDIWPCFGAVGHYGSVAIFERLIHSLKTECTRRWSFIPMRRDAMRHELLRYPDFNAASL